MTINEFIHKVRYDFLASSLDIPLTVNGEEVTDLKFIFKEPLGGGQYKHLSIDLKTKKTSKEELIELDNSEYDYGHNVNHKEYYGG